MARFGRTLPLLIAAWLLPGQAQAWWEATLQQVEVDLTLNQDGTARVRYDLRYHVDRGEFEGVDLVSPSDEVEWDRLASFIEDARGQRVPVRISRRGRDGTLLVRVANSQGLRAGWATVHLEYTADLLGCCLRLDEEERVHLAWSALSWDVGMDRILARVHLEPGAEGLEVDEPTAAELTVDALEGGLIIERIRPVRWYEMRLGLVLPQGWLQRQPERLEELAARPSIDIEETEIALPVHQERDHPRGYLDLLVHLGLALLSWFLLAFKSWVTAKGYSGRERPVQQLLLPRVPPLLRWLVVGLALLAGAWLQARSFLAAGSLAFAAGVLFSLRAPASRTAVPVTRWSEPCGPEELLRLAARKGKGRQRWAALFDGTSLAGLPLALALVAGGLLALRLGSAALAGLVLDGLAVDLVLTLAAFSLTARRRDALPSETESARRLRRALRSLRKLAEIRGLTPQVLLSESEGGAPTDLCLVLCSEPASETRIEVTTSPELGVAGWSLGLVAAVSGGERPVEVRARRSGSLARRLRKALAAASKAP